MGQLCACSSQQESQGCTAELCLTFATRPPQRSPEGPPVSQLLLRIRSRALNLAGHPGGRALPTKARSSQAVIVCSASFSTASAAESFRSRCGSVRRAPVCSSQASWLVAPQVGQGTDNICLRVRSLVFTAIGYCLPQLEICSISDTFALLQVSEFFLGPPPMYQL